RNAQLANPDSPLRKEPASVLLERIRKEREKTGKATARRVPVPPDTANLPDLPEGWVWTVLGDITRNLDGRRVPVKDDDRANMQGPYPYYGASGVIDTVKDFLFDGDYLLIAEDGANLLARSKPIAFQAHGKFWVNNHAHVVQTLGRMPLAFLEHFLNSISLKFAITGSAQPKLTQANMNRLPVSLPPTLEQERIVEELARRFSAVDEAEKAVNKGLRQAERLRQSILKRAFEGQLVPQDPNDEPAEKLLARIRAEREKEDRRPSLGRSRRRRTK
ncbi:MAG: restriction endonuclease subunit S, partial [Planctomycetota bacterium]|nr:restriction endonuclease subunit S [Planctomycetota bacterium]